MEILEPKIYWQAIEAFGENSQYDMPY